MLLERLSPAKRTLLSADDVVLLSADHGGAHVELAKAEGPDKRRTFSMLAYTGVDFPRFWGRMVIDLAGVEAPESLAMLHEHHDEEPVAVATKCAIDDEGIHLTGHMLSNAKAREVVQNADEGLPYKASIGVRRIGGVEQVEEGAEAEVNGRTVIGPIEIWRRCRLFETSFINANPADLASEVEVMHQEVVSMDPKAKDALAQAGALTVDPETEKRLRAEGAKAEGERARSIRAAFPRWPKFAERMVREGVSLDEAKIKAADGVVAGKLKVAATAPKKGDKARLSASEQRELERLQEKAGYPGLGFDGRARQDGRSETTSHLMPEERARVEVGQDLRLKALFQPHTFEDQNLKKTITLSGEALYAKAIEYEHRLRSDGTPFYKAKTVDLVREEIAEHADPTHGPINYERLLQRWTAGERLAGSFGKSGPDYSKIVSKGFLGTFYMRFEQESSGIWAPKLSLRVDSNQEIETHRFLGLFPQLSEWLGGLREDVLPIYEMQQKNRLYRAGIRIDKNDFKFQKFGLINQRIGEGGAVAAEHWNQLLSDLIETNGKSYDGVAYFAATHTFDGGVTTWTNDLTVADYAALKVNDSTNPTPTEFASILVAIVPHMRKIKAANKQPINGGAQRFMLMVPQNMEGAAKAAVNLDRLNYGEGNPTANGVQGWNIEVVANPRLTSSTRIYIFRLDAPGNPPFIMQEPGPPEVLWQGPNSWLEWIAHAYGFGIESTRSAGYGGWECSVRATLST